MIFLPNTLLNLLRVHLISLEALQKLKLLTLCLLNDTVGNNALIKYLYSGMQSKNCMANYYSLFFALSFVGFIFLSHITLPGKAYGETGYIEAFQVILIVSILILGFVRKVFLVNVYSRSTYFLRQSFFGLLFFEEISYLTSNKFNFLDYNLQSELNIHNSNFIHHTFAKITLLGDDAIHLHPLTIIIFLFTVFFFAGENIPFFKRFSIISLHPLVRTGILYYPFNLAFSYLIRNLFSLSDDFYIVNLELIELFLYILFLVDIVIKSFPFLISNSYK